VLLGGAVAIAVLVAAVLLVVWLSLRDYKPFDGTYSEFAPISGVARDVQPVTGSEGKTVFFAEQRKRGLMSLAFDFRNSGNHSVRLDRVYAGDFPGSHFSIYLSDVKIQTRNVERGMKPASFVPFHPIALDPGRTVYLMLDYRTRCFGDEIVGDQTSINVMRVRYSYLRVFHRTEWLPLPFGVVMQCKGKLPASTK
jgi:hypothetical protein